MAGVLMKKFMKMFACLAAMAVSVPSLAVAAKETVHLAAVADSVKLLGRTTVSEEGIEPHSTGAGIAFESKCSGDITLTMTGKPTKFDSLYLAVFIDGEMHRVEFKGQLNRSSTQELVIAEDLSKGKHTIEIVRETEENYGSYVWESLAIDGELNPVKEAPLLIEFVGDSITAGYASYPQPDEDKHLSVEHPKFEAGVKTYAYLTAQALGADFQSVCASGYGVVRGYNYDGVTVPTLYEYAGYYHDNSEDGKWTFERPADIVVINLGANDSDRGTTYEDMAVGAKAFMESVRSHNPDAAIVWVIGENYLKFEQQFADAVEQLGGADSGYYFTVLPEGTGGGAGHPSLEEHAETAQALTQFLEESVFPNHGFNKGNALPWIAVAAAVGAVALAVVLWLIFKLKRAA